MAASSSPGHLGSGGQGSNSAVWTCCRGIHRAPSGTWQRLADFTLTTSAGQEVTVDEETSTKYEMGTTSQAAKSTITKGAHVLVLGTVDSTTIKARSSHGAKQMAVDLSQPLQAAVVPFQKGTAETSKQVGRVPWD